MTAPFPRCPGVTSVAIFFSPPPPAGLLPGGGVSLVRRLPSAASPSWLRVRRQAVESHPPPVVGSAAARIPARSRPRRGPVRAAPCARPVRGRAPFAIAPALCRPVPRRGSPLASPLRGDPLVAVGGLYGYIARGAPLLGDLLLTPRLFGCLSLRLHSGGAPAARRWQGRLCDSRSPRMGSHRAGFDGFSDFRT